MPPIPQTDPGAFVRAHRQEVMTAMERVLDSGWYILGQEVGAFEREFCEAFGYQHAVGVANGTDALALALRAVGLSEGRRVATVSHTAVATVAAIAMAGATPVFIDIDPASFTMDPRALAAALEGPVAIHGVVVVHLYGQPADLAIRDITERRGIPLIEDCAQAHGARIGERSVGGFGAAAAFSFYPTKNLAALGDGGMVAAGDAEIAERVRALRQYGWKRGRISETAGVNSRLDELQAAFLKVRLKHLAAGNRRRAAIAAAYTAGLRGTGLRLPTERPGTTHVYHQYVLRHPERDAFRARLEARGVATTVHYPLAVHQHPAYLGRYENGPGGLQASEDAAREVLSLPMFPELDDSAVAAVIDAVRVSL
jgi:dTDP-4-amino-4,6-dideoxygalactose transaminase